MKIAEYDNSVEIYLSDSSCDEYSIEEGDIFPESENPYEFHPVRYLTIVHPEIPKRAWIVIPQAANVNPHNFCQEFLILWKSGLDLSSVAKVLKEKYFATGELSKFFDNYSKVNYKVQLQAKA
jgi:hypothetical protein